MAKLIIQTNTNKDDQVGVILDEKDPIVITDEAVQKSDKLYICAVSKDGKKQFNVIDISNIRTLIVDTEMPLEVFEEEN